MIPTFVMRKKYIQQRYMIRWRKDYKSGITKLGSWDRPGDSPSQWAYTYSNDGLLRAVIEGKNLENGVTETLAECDGHDFRNFEWIAVSPAPVKNAKVRLIGSIHGMTLMTTNHKYSCHIDGNISRRDLSEAEKKQHLISYGR